MTGVSIIIPTYNRARLLGPTLESVTGLCVPEGCAVEVIVVDNNCTDRTSVVVEEASRCGPFPIVRVVETQQGLCYGRNRGLAEARYEHVVFFDDDILISPDWLHGYFEAVEDLQADCVVGPVRPLYEGGVPPGLTERILASVNSAYSCKGEKMFVLPRELANEIPGSNFAVRRAAGQAVNGFNNSLDRVGRLMLAGGDSDFGVRLAMAGYRTVYQPRCSIQHVITADKLTPESLRRRWEGLGATAGIQSAFRDNLTTIWRLQRTVGLARLYAASVLLRWRGETALSFQRELEFIRKRAFLRTPARSSGGSVARRAGA